MDLIDGNFGPRFVQPEVVDRQHGDEGQEDEGGTAEVPQVVDVIEVQEDALVVQVAGLGGSRIAARVALEVEAQSRNGKGKREDRVEQRLGVGFLVLGLPLHDDEVEEVEQEVEPKDDEQGVGDRLVR